MADLLDRQGINPLVVEAVQADAVGSLHIILGDGFALDIFPDVSISGEHWRLFRPRTKAAHFVVTGEGVKTVEPAGGMNLAVERSI